MDDVYGKRTRDGNIKSGPPSIKAQRLEKVLEKRELRAKKVKKDGDELITSECSDIKKGGDKLITSACPDIKKERLIKKREWRAKKIRFISKMFAEDDKTEATETTEKCGIPLAKCLFSDEK